MLELDDGTCLSETLAICRGFQELHPEPNLFGSTALERATIEMWSRFIEFNLWLPTGMAFLLYHRFLQRPGAGLPLNGEECKQQVEHRFESLMPVLPRRPILRGSASPSPAILPCTIDFGKAVGLRITPEQPRLQDGMTGECPAQRPGLILSPNVQGVQDDRVVHCRHAQRVQGVDCPRTSWGCPTRSFPLISRRHGQQKKPEFSWPSTPMALIPAIIDRGQW